MNAQIIAHSLANRHSKKLVILYECEHKEKKQKHHPDYDKPYEVELLCCKCHGKRQRQISNKIKKVPLDIQKLFIGKEIPKFKMHKIYTAMEKQRWTKSALTRKIGVSRQGLYYYLNHPTTDNIWTLAYYLKLDIKDLIK